MKTAKLLAAVLTALACSLLVSCDSGQGPLLINVSGQSVQLHVQTDRGEGYDGACEDQAAVWVGRSGATTTRVEIKMAAATYVLEGDDLLVRFGKDKATAFAIESTGPRKLELREAEALMRNKPEIHRAY
jgi:deoxyxylulose-5-phosphate synthase